MIFLRIGLLRDTEVSILRHNIDLHHNKVLEENCGTPLCTIICDG